MLWHRRAPLDRRRHGTTPKKKGGLACSLRELVGSRRPTGPKLRQSGTGDGASPSKSLAWSDFSAALESFRDLVDVVPLDHEEKGGSH